MPTVPMKRTVLLLASVLVVASVAVAAQPHRAGGLSVHMLPKSVADISGEKAGFTISALADRTPPRGTPTMETAQALVNYFRKQAPELQRNGIWVVTTHPDGYSSAETKNLERLKDLCRRGKIALFTCRGSELPTGWKRQDR